MEYKVTVVYDFYSSDDCAQNCARKIQMKKINKKWVPHELSETHREMHETYSNLNLKNYKQQKTRLQHTITIYKT